METANLIMLIVALIVLLALSFFIFQVWIQSKETKLQINNFMQEIQKGFSSSDISLKAAVEQICLQHTSESKFTIAALESIQEQLKLINGDVKKAKDEINQHVVTSLETSDTKLNESFELLKTKTYNRIGELNETSKLFKEQLEDRIKELDRHLTEKLVYDLTELTKRYSGDLVERNTETLKSFSSITKDYTDELKQKHQETIQLLLKTSNENNEHLKQKHQDTMTAFNNATKEISEEQTRILKAITDPLSIKN